MAEFVHWCGNCQIRIYIERHYGTRLNWVNCSYMCDYATKMRHISEETRNGEGETNEHTD